MVNYALAAELLRLARSRGIDINLIRDGRFISWRCPAGAMTHQLESDMQDETDSLVAYLRWEEDRKGHQTPLNQIQDRPSYEHR